MFMEVLDSSSGSSCAGPTPSPCAAGAPKLLLLLLLLLLPLLLLVLLLRVSLPACAPAVSHVLIFPFSWNSAVFKSFRVFGNLFREFGLQNGSFSLIFKGETTPVFLQIPFGRF